MVPGWSNYEVQKRGGFSCSPFLLNSRNSAGGNDPVGLLEHGERIFCNENMIIAPIFLGSFPNRAG